MTTRRYVAALVFAVILGGCPSWLWAQSPINPTRIEFDHEDFAMTDFYELGYQQPGASAPQIVVALVKPGSCSPCSGLLVSRPTALGNWQVGVRAVAGGVRSEWSPFVDFVRAPSAPVIRTLLR